MLTLSEHDKRLVSNNRNKFFNKHQAWTCRAPYTTLNIGKTGEAYICYSPSWLPVNIGSVLTADSLDDLWFGDRAEEIRSSVAGSMHAPADYFYCNSKLCQLLKKVDRTKVTKDDFKEVNRARAVPAVNHPTQLNLDFDHTCNFACPMCRTKVITDDDPRGTIITDKVIAWLDTVSTPLEVKLNGGEPFMSKHYQRIMQHIAGLSGPVTIEIASNGSTLLANRKLIEQLGSKISSFRISFDAATEETYNKIRRGGNWKNLLKNMEMLASIDDRPFKITTDFVIQLDNYLEMPAYVELADSLGADDIRVQNMWNWNTWSDEEFAEKNVFDARHTRYTEMRQLINSINNPKFFTRWKDDGN